MTSDKTDPDEPSDDPSKTPADGSRGFLGWIRMVVEAIGAIEREEGGHRRASGRVDRGAAHLDYEYDVSVGLGDRPGSPQGRPDVDRSRSDQNSHGRVSDLTPVHVQTRAVTDDELVVAVDLPGVTDDELDVTLDTSEPALELTARGALVDRISIDHPDVTISDTSLTNQILEVTLAREDDTSGETVSDDEGNSNE